MKKTYQYWIKRIILFHGKRHPQQMGVVLSIDVPDMTAAGKFVTVGW